MQTSSPFSLRHCDFVARFFYSFPLRFKKRLETHLASATGSVSPQTRGSFPPQANYFFFFFSCVWAGCTCKVFVFVVCYPGEECAWCETLRKKLSLYQEIAQKSQSMGILFERHIPPLQGQGRGNICLLTVYYCRSSNCPNQLINGRHFIWKSAEKSHEAALTCIHLVPYMIRAQCCSPVDI